MTICATTERRHCSQDLQYLNLAMNNIVAVENLQGCEALQKLDLTMNFIPAAALPSLATLRGLYNLRNLYLLGNPCMEWKKARQFIIGYLPQLQAMVSSMDIYLVGRARSLNNRA